TLPSCAFNQAFILEYTREELSFVLRIEDPKRQMDQLCFVDEEYKVVLSNGCAFNLVPFQRHPFPGIDLHNDLLTADLIREFLEQHFSLLELRHAVELHPPEEHVKSEADNGADEPPDAGNPDVAQTDNEGHKGSNPSLAFHDLPEREADISFFVELVILCF